MGQNNSQPARFCLSSMDGHISDNAFLEGPSSLRRVPCILGT
jgi:hypothetical protein